MNKVFNSFVNLFIRPNVRMFAFLAVCTIIGFFFGHALYGFLIGVLIVAILTMILPPYE